MANRSSLPRPARLPSPSYHVNSFRDALGLAFELHATYGPGRFALLSDHRQRPVQLSVHLTGRPGPCRMHHWAVELGPGPGAWAAIARCGGGLLVISVGRCPPRPLSPAEAAAYRRSRAALARHGITLRDWIRTDADSFISAAHALEPDSAWPGDPPAQRRADRAAAGGGP